MMSISTSAAVSSLRRIEVMVARNAPQHCRIACRSLSLSSSSLFHQKRVGKGGSGNNNNSNNDQHQEQKPRHPQPFVHTDIEPTTWDPEMKDPLYKPKWRARGTKIIRAEDFANRPSVGFSNDFDSFQDAMVTWCWMDQTDKKNIYQLYIDLMQNMHERNLIKSGDDDDGPAKDGGGGGDDKGTTIESAGKRRSRTSHEYVMRLIAQKFNISAERAAAVVEIQHMEEQMLKNDPEMEKDMLSEEADMMDALIKDEINEAYQTFGLRRPTEFIEDPSGTAGHKESKKFTDVDDLLDVDTIMKDTLIRDDERARLMINSYIYEEDIDDEDVDVPLDKGCRQLLKAQKKMKKVGAPADGDKFTVRLPKKVRERLGGDDVVTIEWPKKSGGANRPKRDFVAQVVNIRELHKSNKNKPKRLRSKSYHNDSPYNTLVENGGNLRGANMADVRKTEWHPMVRVQEHTYKNVKKGWLARVNRNDTSAWGKAPPKSQRQHEQQERERKQKEEEEAAAAAAAAAAASEEDAQTDESEENNSDSQSTADEGEADSKQGTEDEKNEKD